MIAVSNSLYGYYHCLPCKRGDRVFPITLPYVTKLMIHELMAMGIYVKIVLEEPLTKETLPHKLEDTVGQLNTLLKEAKQLLTQSAPSHKRTEAPADAVPEESSSSSSPPISKNKRVKTNAAGRKRNE